ncbi:MAG: hypothetical protein Ta2A_10010 [Treponemataceae bacterium]|nr:MAG: hypothetical protein Ta2A_10010 [Treponemataceae bacterium]
MHTTTEKRNPIDERGVTSILETLDVDTHARTVLKEFDKTIEAPNWTKDGNALIFNETGKI